MHAAYAKRKIRPPAAPTLTGRSLPTPAPLLPAPPPAQSLEVLVAWAERSAAGWAARCQWVAALSSAKGGPASGQFAAQPHLLFPPPAAAAALPAYLAPPPLAFNWERFERQTVLMREQIERFLDGGAEPLMPGWLDLPDGIGLIDTLPERIEHGIHYTGPAIDINIM